MSDFGKDLIASMQEALDHSRGKKGDLVTHKVKSVDTRTIRTNLKLTQKQMSILLGMSLGGYRKWEQGTRTPNGAALTLLKVMEEEPEAVLRAIA